MIAGGGSTTDYWELEKQAQWLGKRGEKQKKRPTYEKVVHDKEWRFYPSKSTGSIGSSYDNNGRSKTLVQEYIERKQRKKRPRTLRPIPFPARAPGWQVLAYTQDCHRLGSMAMHLRKRTVVICCRLPCHHIILMWVTQATQQRINLFKKVACWSQRRMDT